MAKFLHTQYSFSSGELNPRLIGRTDIKEYYNAGKEITNFVIGPDAGLNQFRGSLWLGPDDGTGIDFTFQEKYAVKLSQDGPIYFKLYELVYSSTYQSYFLEEIPLTLGSIIPVAYNSFEYGTHVSINDVTIITDARGFREPIVISKINSSPEEWYIYTWRDYAAEVGNPYVSEDERIAHSIPFNPVTVDQTNYLSLAGTTLTSTFSFLDSSYLGTHIKLSDSTNDYIVRVDSITNPGVEAKVTIIEGTPPNGDYIAYSLPAWREGLFPKIVNYFQGRSLFANTETSFDILWNSEAGDIVHLTQPLSPTTPDSSSAFFIQPNTNNATPISWVVVERYVTMGTHTAEYIAQGLEGQYTSALSTITEVSRYGSSEIIGLAFRAQASTYFIERDGRTLREMSFSEENGGYVSRNIGLLGPELGKVSRVLYDYPNKRIYLSDSNSLYTVTIDSASGVLGWTRIDLSAKVGGVLSIDNNTILIHRENLGTSIEALLFYTELEKGGAVNLSSDVLYPIGKDIVGVGTTIDPDYYILPDNYTTAPASVNAFDAENEVWVSLPTAINTGGANPDIPVDALYVYSPDFEVQIVSSGLPAKARVVTTPFQQGSPIGDGQAGIQRIDKAVIRLLKSKRGFTLGTSEDSLEEVEIEGEFTGVKQVSPDGCPEYDHSVIIENESIWPIVILGLSVRGMEQEG